MSTTQQQTHEKQQLEKQRTEHNLIREPPQYSTANPHDRDPRTLDFPSLPGISGDGSESIVETGEERSMVRSGNLNHQNVIGAKRLEIRNLLAPTATSAPALASKPPTSPERVAKMEQQSREYDGSLAPSLEKGSTAMDVDSVASTDERAHRAGSVVSMDDPDVRIAAEALGDLRADFIQSPSNRSHSSFAKNIVYSPPALHSHNGAISVQSHPEPLLSLFTSSHPILGTAINGSLSAYSSSKSYSPSFKYGAEFVERHIGTPVVSTVGTVGRKTGVEGGMRWWLGARQPEEGSEQDFEDQGSSKRRRVGDIPSDADIEKGLRDSYTLPPSSRRRMSEASFADSLPAYDDHRSPDYEAQVTMIQAHEGESSTANPNWQRRLMLSTSGLGVAMSDESLRSLKYCLTWLRWANIHLGKVIFKLKDVLTEWDQSQDANRQSEGTPNGTVFESEERQNPLRTPTTAETEEALSTRIQTLKSDVLQTLKTVVDIVSTYAGGALPENARLLVRRHLTSLPQRFLIASGSKPPNTSSDRPASETVSSAHRVMVLAQEGLDMMAQVSGVVDGTIVSAEDWCERLGKRKPEAEQDGTVSPSLVADEKAAIKVEEGNGDIVMGGETETKA